MVNLIKRCTIATMAAFALKVVAFFFGVQCGKETILEWVSSVLDAKWILCIGFDKASLSCVRTCLVKEMPFDNFEGVPADAEYLDVQVACCENFERGNVEMFFSSKLAVWSDDTSLDTLLDICIACCYISIRLAFM